MTYHSGNTTLRATSILAGCCFALLAQATDFQYDEEFWYQDNAGKDGMTEEHDRFGRALANGDFNGDGFEDLAIGVPGESLNHLNGAGAVHVMYGYAKGLNREDYQNWHLDQSGVTGHAQAGDNYGHAVAAGDFNHDGYDDLAIGIPYRDVSHKGSAGMIHVLYGSRHGLDTFDNQMWHQDSPEILGSSEAGDYFGQALAAGDFNYDGYDDLAVGVPGEDIDHVRQAGAVNLIMGSQSGLNHYDNQMWYQGRGITGHPEEGDRFGFALAVGDFDGDRFQDLAVGVPGEDLSPGQLNVYLEDVGAVHVIRGAAHGLTKDQATFWHQDSSGIAGQGDNFDAFGAALAAGDFDGDTYDDLAVGAPMKQINHEREAGAVTAIYGTRHGLKSSRSRQYHQDNHNIPGAAEKGDHFGLSLTAGDLNGDGFADLAVAHPDEDLYSRTDGGAVVVISGSHAGLMRHSHQLWHQNVEHLSSSVEHDDRFGRALATGDFDGDGRADLVIAVPDEDIDHVKNAGAIHVLYLDTFSINFGLSGSWTNPDAPDQGFMIEVIADTQMLLVRWFTYAGHEEAYGDERDQRWYSVVADYDGTRARGDVQSSTGGYFDDTQPTTASMPEHVGTLELEFSGCATGMARYKMFESGRTGHFPIERTTGPSEHCQQQ